MAQIAVAPLVLKDVIMTLGADDYNKHVDKVEFVPAASSISWTGLDGNSFTDIATATWGAAIGYVQDWETEDSLSQYLLEHEGEQVAAVFAPKTGSGPTFTATLTITPGSIGGSVNSYATATVTLGSTRPVLVPAASAIPLLTSVLPVSQGAGDLVTITGHRFTGTTDVNFGAVDAPVFLVVSDTSLTVLMPADAAGSVSVVVTNATGASAGLAYTRT